MTREDWEVGDAGGRGFPAAATRACKNVHFPHQSLKRAGRGQHIVLEYGVLERMAQKCEFIIYMLCTNETYKNDRLSTISTAGKNIFSH